MSINAVGQPIFQLGGLASGLNTTDIVSKLVQVERMPETQMLQKQATLNKQKSAWLQVNTLMAAFDTSMLNLKNTSTWNTSKVTSSDPTVLTALGSSTATGSYNVTVNNLATQQAFSVKGAALTSATTALSSQGISGNLTVSTVDATGTSHSLTIDLGGTTLNPAGNTLNDVAAAINNPVNGLTYGVTASVVQVAGGYALTVVTNQTGASATVNQAGKTTVSTTSGQLTAASTQSATDASLTVNGLTITSASNTVNGVIPGVSLTLQKNSGTSTVNLVNDASVAQSAVQDMVTKYNALMDYIAQATSYDSTKKVAGDLFGDPTLQTLQSQLRTMMGNTITNPTIPYTTLASIGITTSSTDFGKSADLQLDTTKFAAAMATNSQSIANMFGSPIGLGQNTMTTGLAISMDAFVQPYIQYGGMLSSQTDSLTGQVNDLQNQIDAWEKHVTSYQTRLTQQFTAMEQAISQMQSQSSSFLAQMTSWQNQKK
ncbi:MAG: flagellar filament capping protein FliD [Desulfitobacteriaceae bacterium]